MDLANRVRQRREELGMSQEDLAMRMGYSSRTSVNKIENGRPCSQKIIARLAEALGVSIPYLMGWDEEKAIEMHKKNDVLSDIIIELRTDEDFMSIVEAIYKMDKDKRSSLLAFLK
jgi:transcriptional regulator with XRE-family HTH domain